ncbi:MAG: hypothetical protein HQM03_14475 [Magnetococcales bacterium]|nr:hypothetical protein [Magnetococcales bacterium]
MDILHTDDSRGEASLLAAFATLDGKRVDRHFGRTPRFDLHVIDRDGSRLLRILRSRESEEHAGRIAERVGMLAGCQLLFCAALGESADRALRGVGILAVVVAPGTPIPTLIEGVRSRSQLGMPPPRDTGEARFAAMLSNGWDG